MGKPKVSPLAVFSMGLPAAMLLLAAALTLVPADAFPATGRAQFADFQGQMERLWNDGRSLTERTWQAAWGTQPACEAPTRESPMAGLNAPTVRLTPSGNLLGVQALNASCVSVAVHLQGPDLHHKWDDFTPAYRQIRHFELTTHHSQIVPVTITAVGPAGTTVITGEQALSPVER